MVECRYSQPAWPLRRRLLSSLLLLISSVLLKLSATRSTAAAETTSSLQVGESPPPLLGPNRKGDMVDLDQHRGKVVVVTFWATWCAPCRRELPILAHMKNLIAADAMDAIAVNWDESCSKGIAFARGNSTLDLEYVFDSKGKTAALFGIRSAPHMFLLDREGQIAAIHRGYSEEGQPAILQNVLELPPDQVKARPPRNVTSK